MSAKMQFSLMEENRDWPKQIGCMNGIFQIFDRHNSLTTWLTSSSNNNNKRLLLGAERQSTPHCSTKAALEKDVEVKKEKQRAAKDRSFLTQTSPNTDRECLDLRDVVKDSVRRESNGKRRGHVIKHIDSPRPILQPKSRNHGSPTLAKPQESARIFKDERLALHRYSYDERDSRETIRSTMKLKELPRLSLDSKASSLKVSFLEPRFNYLENENSDPVQPESRRRSSSIVVKLMGLDAFPDTSFKDPSLPISSTTAQKRKQDRASTYSSSSSSPRTSLNDSAAASSPALPSSVYAELEKRIAELEFQKSGKDVRVLKQILESMAKTSKRVEKQRAEFSEASSPRRCGLTDGISDQKSNLSKWQNRRKSHKVVEEVNVPQISEMQHLRRIQTRDSKHQKEKPTHGNYKTKDLTTRSSNLKYGRTTELGVGSPRLRHVDLLKTQGRSSSSANSTEFGRIKSHSSQKAVQRAPQNRNRVKSRVLEVNDEQFSEICSETRVSSSQGETDSVKSESSASVTKDICLAQSIKTNGRQHMNAVSTFRDHVSGTEPELAGTTQEQPSPVSVLDATFYCEGSPSPVKKISTAFTEETPNPDESEWHFERLIHCPRSDLGYCNQNLETIKHIVEELKLLETTEPNETAAIQNQTRSYDTLNPDHRYISNILHATGLLKNAASDLLSSDHLQSSCHHLINPDMFNLLEQILGQNDEKLGMKMRRKIVFDMVNEVLVRKISSGGSLARGRDRRTLSPEVLLEKEVHLEMDRLCGMADGNLDHEGGVGSLNRILAADMMHESEDWSEYRADFPELALDIERQIFKDMVTEVITGELMNLLPQRRRSFCRQLF